MDDKIADHLIELARAFNEIGLKPLICGGMGVYLTFHGLETEIPIRTTNDIDLMLTKTEIADQSRRSTIAHIVNDELKYTVRERSRHFQFQKGEQQLDILAQPTEGIRPKNFRTEIVKSKLHGYHTPEAAFIHEDLIEVSLSQAWPGNNMARGLDVLVPCLTNQLILKLYAFNDRNEGHRRNDAQAQAHAYDIYVILTLANINDYRQGQKFLSRHSEAEVIQKAKSIISCGFSLIDQAGWLRVLQTSIFYPNLTMQQKRSQVDQARRRLIKWFNVA